MKRKKRQIVKSFSRGESPWKLTPNSLDWCSSHWTFYFINPCPLFIAVLSSKLTDPKVPWPPVKDNFLEDSSVQFSSVVQSCPTLCNPMNCNTPGLPVHHQLPESTQTHVHPSISSSVIPFSSCPQSFQASGSFPMSQLFVSGGPNIGVSASTSILPMNTQDWSPLGWTGWISLQSKGLSRVFSNTIVQKHQFFSTQLSL